MKRRSSRAVLAIDPGVTNMGWAYWEGGSSLTPTAVGDLAPEDPSAHLGERLTELNLNLYNILRPVAREDCYQWITLVLELPEFQGGRGRAAAGGGSLVTLSMAACALLCSAAEVFPVAHYEFLTATQWKGNLKKAVTRREARRILGAEYGRDLSHDAMDAVALGLYWLVPEYLDGAS